MQAIVQREYGSAADVLALEEIARPEPADGEVLIRVHAVAVGPEAWHLITGRPYFVRLMGFGVRRPKTLVPARDVAGVVEGVGGGVTAFDAGEAVFGSCRGALAQYAVAGAAAEAGVGGDGVLAPKPANLTFEQAASVTTSGLTALQALRDAGKVEADQEVLVIGASGGVGTFAVQLAKDFGARVTGVCSAAKAELVRSLGADRVVAYEREDFTEGSDQYDLIIDTAGRRGLLSVRRALTPKGRLVIVGGEGGNRWTGGFERQLRALALSPLIGQSLHPLTAVDRRSDLLFLKERIEAGAVTPVVDRVHPLADAALALADAEEGHGRGKRVIAVASD